MMSALVMTAQSASAWDLPLDVDVIKIYFNHNTGSEASDGITIQEDKTTIAAPEWYPAASKNEESAFLKSVNTPTVKAEFYANDIAQQGYYGVTVYADKKSGEGTWELSESSMTFSPGGGSGQVSFITDPNNDQDETVGKWTFTWEWKVTEVDEESVSPFSIGESTHTYYNTYASPSSPMDTTWVEVLDYACVWAQGEDTLAGAATEVAAGIYNNENLEYVKPAQYTGENGFNLTGFYLLFNPVIRMLIVTTVQIHSVSFQMQSVVQLKHYVVKGLLQPIR